MVSIKSEPFFVAPNILETSWVWWYCTHIFRVQRDAQPDHAQVAGRQQVEILAQRFGGGSGNLLGQLGHVHRVLVVVGLVVRLRTNNEIECEKSGWFRCWTIANNLQHCESECKHFGKWNTDDSFLQFCLWYQLLPKRTDRLLCAAAWSYSDLKTQCSKTHLQDKHLRPANDVIVAGVILASMHAYAGYAGHWTAVNRRSNAKWDGNHVELKRIQLNKQVLQSNIYPWYNFAKYLFISSICWNMNNNKWNKGQRIDLVSYRYYKHY